jgi:hypothetical protein
MKKFSPGSIKMEMSVASDSYSSWAEAQKEMHSANLIPSGYVYSKSTTVVGY